MPSLRTCWRLTRTEPCCTTSTSLEERRKERHGTSGSEQRAIGLFGQRRSSLTPPFLQDRGVRSFAEDPSQDSPPSLHRQHGPPPSTRGTLVGSLDPWQPNRSDGQLCPALGNVSASGPSREWIVRHWKYLTTNGKSLQAINSNSCGDYALLYPKAKARGRPLQEFLNDFSDHDYVSNDHKEATRVKQLICNELGWHQVCQTPYHQRCC